MTTVIQKIADQIVNHMEQAKAEGDSWEKPWLGGNGLTLPMNATTHAEYRGANILILAISGHHQGFTSNLWATYKQWQSVGAQVRKGEKATNGAKYGTFEKDSGKFDADMNPVFDKVPYVRPFAVFNADQVNGFDLPETDKERPDLAKRIKSAEAFVSNTGADVRHSDQRAAYYRHRSKTSGEGDYIHMPTMDLFIDTTHSTATENYYSTLLHELTHWTGDKRRLDRQKGVRFGDKKYAFEELVAELGAAFHCAHLEISNTPRMDHAQYLNSWIQCLKDHPKAIMTACARASDALDYTRELQNQTALAA
jgi:antirestriction protein ArdC